VNFCNPLMPSFATDFFYNGPTKPASQGQLTGTGYLPITATPDVANGNPYLGGGGPRTMQLAVRLNF